jgi:hypothetical protein
MMIATRRDWEVRWPGGYEFYRILPDGPGRSRIDQRFLASEHGRLIVCWVVRDFINEPPMDPRARPNQILPPSKQRDTWEDMGREYEIVRRSVIALRTVDAAGWVWGCELWVVRYVLGVVVGLALWGAWHTRPRRPPGHCKRCGYSLAGLAAGSICPECGTPSASPPEPAAPRI